ncbi:MAG: biotin/lipoyl-binding protein [Proteobacteria bacterium]|nr:biotin/lipoyl-binding protein [Pseudomonadota bacterium]MBU2468246.1 biotin/lipoyl-binding protein [Pseudomonadota bacterium]MBU2518174.1 biotin/lipoyl-binding protein [Pseudomonadota bacterium]
MSLGHNDIIEIMKLFRESQFNNICIESGDFKLVISKDGHDPSHQNGHRQTRDIPADNKNILNNAAGMPVTAAADFISEQATLDYDQIEREGLKIFRSPMLGVFYRSPNPGAAPFVQEGSQVDLGTTLCIIEVMKLYTSITSDVPGKIAKVCVQDGQMVEYGQPLFLIEPQANTNGE